MACVECQCSVEGDSSQDQLLFRDKHRESQEDGFELELIGLKGWNVSIAVMVIKPVMMPVKMITMMRTMMMLMTMMMMMIMKEI